MGRRRKRRFTRIYEALDLPVEADLITPRITMTGDAALLIENAGRALTCTNALVRLETALDILRIEGGGLVLKEYAEGRVFLSGRIRSIAYERADGV